MVTAKQLHVSASNRPSSGCISNEGMRAVQYKQYRSYIVYFTALSPFH